MSEKQNSLLTKKKELQTQGLNLERILSYLKSSGLQSHQENSSIKRYRNDALDFFVEYVCRNERIDLKELLEELERTILIKILSKFNGNQKNAAKFLGIKYTTLNEKVKKYNIHFHKKPVVNSCGTSIPES